MVESFTRTIQLIGEDAFSSLASSTVAVIGLGGVGSHCAEALARSGVGRLYLVDADVVAPSNINRQGIALMSTIGRPKAQVMKERIADINPDCDAVAVQEFILPENIEDVFSRFPKRPDYLIDAIDTVSAKLALAAYAYADQIPILASMGTGNKLHPEQFVIGDIYSTSVCPLCRVMRRELKKRGIPALRVLYSREEPALLKAEGEQKSSGRPAPASISFVPPVAGLLIAGEVIRELAGLTPSVSAKNTRKTGPSSPH